MPLIVIIALLIGGTGGGSPSAGPSTPPENLPPVTVSPPPSNPATAGPCAKVIGALPLSLAGQKVRKTATDPASPFVVAWGEPAIVLRCGVSRPASLRPGSTERLFSALGANGPYFEVTRNADANVYTFIDRPVYIDLTVPATYHARPVPPVARAITRVLPRVCKPAPAPGGKAVPPEELCTHRR